MCFLVISRIIGSYSKRSNDLLRFDPLFARPSFPGCGGLLFGHKCIIGVKAPVVLGGCFVRLAIVGSIDVKYPSSFGFVAIADRHIQITNGVYGDY